MRRGAPFLLAMLPVGMTACSAEKSFDERYDAAEAEVRDKARSIDQDLQQSQGETNSDNAPERAPASPETANEQR